MFYRNEKEFDDMYLTYEMNEQLLQEDRMYFI